MLLLVVVAVGVVVGVVVAVVVLVLVLQGPSVPDGWAAELVPPLPPPRWSAWLTRPRRTRAMATMTWSCCWLGRVGPAQGQLHPYTVRGDGAGRTGAAGLFSGAGWGRGRARLSRAQWPDRRGW